MDRRTTRLASLAVALVATAGSLYFSLGMGLVPCRLCWYQRILMYPQVVVLGAALTDDVAVDRAALPLSLLGVAIAAYHSWLQVAGGGTCGGFGCAAVQLRVLGLTIPNLSLAAFSMLAVLEWRDGRLSA